MKNSGNPAYVSLCFIFFHYSLIIHQVWGCVPPWQCGCIGEYVVVRREWLSVKPSSIKHAEAAAVPYAGCAALQALEILHQKQNEDHVPDLTGKR